MKIGQMTTSKYLKGADVDPPRLLTFRSFKKENVAKADEPEEHKWVAYFDGEDKGLVLNKVNLERAARALGSDDTDDWIGKPIVVFYDPNVEFGGKLVGGIRLRAPKPPSQRIAEAAPLQGAALARASIGRGPPPPAEVEDEDDGIPF